MMREDTLVLKTFIVIVLSMIFASLGCNPEPKKSKAYKKLKSKCKKSKKEMSSEMSSIVSNNEELSSKNESLKKKVKDLKKEIDSLKSRPSNIYREIVKPVSPESKISLSENQNKEEKRAAKELSDFAKKYPESPYAKKAKEIKDKLERRISRREAKIKKAQRDLERAVQNCEATMEQLDDTQDNVRFKNGRVDMNHIMRRKERIENIRERGRTYYGRAYEIIKKGVPGSIEDLKNKAVECCEEMEEISDKSCSI